jgi:pseudouridine-5'-phosphate glycosidase
MKVLNRSGANAVALETTLLIHGLPSDAAGILAGRLSAIAVAEGATAAFVGVLDGQPIVGLTDSELQTMLDQVEVPKVNTANLGVAIYQEKSGATTVGSTMELAAAAGLSVFATGGIGGVHRDYGKRWDISSDLGAFARYPMAVVTSGAKSILDVKATREALETLGICVVGYRCDAFPAFYLRESDCGVDVRFDEIDALAGFLSAEMERVKRGIVVANPIPEEQQIDPEDWEAWRKEAEQLARAKGASGRNLTPAILAALHKISNGKTLEANLALVENNVRVAAQIAASMGAG